MKQKELPIQVEEENFIPLYATDLAAGADLKASLKEPIFLEPGERQLIPTGVRLEIPEGFEVQVRPRSGLAFKYGVTVLNAPGTIDADFRGEVSVLLINLGKERFVVEPNMRIAQMVLSEVVQAKFVRSELLGATKRGEGSFGHTGEN